MDNLEKDAIEYLIKSGKKDLSKLHKKQVLAKRENGTIYTTTVYESNEDEHSEKEPKSLEDVLAQVGNERNLLNWAKKHNITFEHNKISPKKTIENCKQAIRDYFNGDKKKPQEEKPKVEPKPQEEEKVVEPTPAPQEEDIKLSKELEELWQKVQKLKENEPLVPLTSKSDFSMDLWYVLHTTLGKPKTRKELQERVNTILKNQCIYASLGFVAFQTVTYDGDVKLLNTYTGRNFESVNEFRSSAFVNVLANLHDEYDLKTQKQAYRRLIAQYVCTDANSVNVLDTDGNPFRAIVSNGTHKVCIECDDTLNFSAYLVDDNNKQVGEIKDIAHIKDIEQTVDTLYNEAPPKENPPKELPPKFENIKKIFNYALYSSVTTEFTPKDDGTMDYSLTYKGTTVRGNFSIVDGGVVLTSFNRTKNTTKRYYVGDTYSLYTYNDIVVDVVKKLKAEIKKQRQEEELKKQEERMKKSKETADIVAYTKVKQTDNKKMFPDFLTTKKGDEIKKGEPMSFAEADSGATNPKFGTTKGYRINCQTCVVAFEARLRGYDVQAKPNPGNRDFYDPSAYLSRHCFDAWDDTSDKKTAPRTKDKQEVVDWIKSTMKKGERYVLEVSWTHTKGHIVNAMVDDRGIPFIYDAQPNKFYFGDEMVKFFEKAITNDYGNDNPHLLRIDNKGFTDRVDNLFEKPSKKKK